MKLIEVGRGTGQAYPSFRVICCHCGFISQSIESRWWADLEGEPFKAYYCQKCVDFHNLVKGV